MIGSITPFFAASLLFVSFFPLLPSSTFAGPQQTTETAIGATTISTADQSATATSGGSTNPITFTLRMEDQGAGGEAGVSSSPTTSAATSSSNLSTRNIGIDVNIVRSGNEAAQAIILPINVTIPANVNNLELCASSPVMTFGATAEKCEPVLHTIDLTQNGAAAGGGGTAATDDTTTAPGTTTSSSSSSPSSSSSAPTITAPPPTTSSSPATTTAGGGSNSLIAGGGIIEEDNAAEIMIPITVIAPIAADIQNAQLCAQLLSSSGAQTCNQIILNPQQTSYSPVNVDMTTSPNPTVISSSEGTGETGTGEGAATSSSSSTTTTITTTPGTTSTTPPTTTTTPPTSTNSNNTTTGGATSSLPASGGRDTIGPTLTVPNDMALQTNGPTALLEYSARAQDDRDGTATLDEDNQLIQGDNVGGRIIITCSPSSQYFLPVGNRTVECSAFDAVNNTGTASFVVSVTRPTTLPGGTSGGSAGGIATSLSANPPIYNGPCPARIEFSGTITDNVGNRDVRYKFIRSDGAGDTEKVIHFDQPGPQTVSDSWTLGDINLLPSFQGWEAIEILQPIQLQSNRAEFQMTCAPSTGGGTAPGGTDTIAPSLSVPVDRVIPTTSPTGEELVKYDVSATDNIDGTGRLDENNNLIQEDTVGGSVTISCTPASNTNFPLGDHTVQCIATDAAGNQGTASFVVSVTRSSSSAATLQAEEPATTTDEEEGEDETTTTTTAAPSPPATTDEEEGGGEGGGGEPPAPTTEDEESPPSDETGG